jgi:hypothetical protein
MTPAVLSVRHIFQSDCCEYFVARVAGGAATTSRFGANAVVDGYAGYSQGSTYYKFSESTLTTYISTFGRMTARSRGGVPSPPTVTRPGVVVIVVTPIAAGGASSTGTFTNGGIWSRVATTSRGKVSLDFFDRMSAIITTAPAKRHLTRWWRMRLSSSSMIEEMS